MTDRTTATGRGGALERLVRDWYLARLDMHLDALVPGAERRRVVRAVRQDIDAERATQPLREVLAGLGKPAELARGFAAGGARRRPHWVAGILAGGTALLVWWFAFFAYSLGMIDVVHRSGLGRARSTFFGIDVLVRYDSRAIELVWGGTSAWLVPLALAAAAVLLGGRAWRLVVR